MLRYFLMPVIFLILLFPIEDSYGLEDFDVTGLQPTAPFGVFSVFSADSLQRGKVAVSTDAQILTDPDFYRFLFKTAYGITDSIELNITVPYIYEWADSVDGFEDVALGLKHRFIDEGKYGPSIAYILNASIPSGRDEFSTDGRYGGGIIISKRVGPLKGHANIFYEETDKEGLYEEIFLGAGLDFAAAHNFNFIAEVEFKKNHDTKEFDSLKGRIGYRIKTHDMIYMTLGTGINLKNRGPDYRIILSISFLSPMKKKSVRKVYEEE